MSSCVHYSNDTQNVPLRGSDYYLRYLKLEEEDDAKEAEEMERRKAEQREFDEKRKSKSGQHDKT